MKRGDVYWIQFDRPDKQRPAVFLTSNLKTIQIQVAFSLK